jgi:RNA polymerase nonessential primary-like sigma factor
MREKLKKPFVDKTRGYSGMTLEEVADILGVTRERVRQIEVEALTKLRAELHKRGLELKDIL